MNAVNQYLCEHMFALYAFVCYNIHMKSIKANKAIKYRIYPTAKQVELINNTFGCVRFVYNHMLAESIDTYAKGENFASRNAFNYRLTSLKKEYAWLCNVDSTALQGANDHLADAFSRFFKKQNDFPVFHKKKYEGCYTSKCVNKSIRLEDKAIRLPKLGVVRAKIHRQPKTDWKLKSATVRREDDGKYYVSVLFEFEADVSSSEPVRSVGLDYKSDGLYMDSEGNIGSNHKYFREGLERLAKAQRKLSRMMEDNIAGYRTGPKGGRVPVYKRPLSECKNIQKQKLKVAKIHRHIANQRLDNLHKLSTEIANQYDVVCVESLDMKSMSNKGFGNGKATLDNGYGLFLDMLEYKLHDRGKYFIRVDKWFPSSQICHSCGSIHKLDLSERTYRCPDCDAVLDRDLNAALNIRDEGLRILKEAS